MLHERVRRTFRWSIPGVAIACACVVFAACDSDSVDDAGLDGGHDADAGDALGDPDEVMGDADADADTDETIDGDQDGDGEVAADPEGFQYSTRLDQARSNHTATLLLDGRVLVVGGEDIVTRDPYDSVEIFDPETEDWSPGPSLPEPRSNHIAVRLDDGRVLVAGGGRSAPIGVPSGIDVLSSAVIFDPETMSWSATGDLNEGRSHFAAALLASGKVLVSGGGAGTHEHGSTCTGVEDCGPLADTLGSAEVYDRSLGTFTVVGSMAEPRDMHTLTALLDGRVIAVAGANDYQESFFSTEIFDEATEEWTAGPNLASLDRFFHSAALLPSGLVLVGGGKKSNVAILDSVVTIDAVEETSELTDSLSQAHTAGAFVVLQSGRILSVGGFHCPSPCESIADAEIYDEETAQWRAIDPLGAARSGHTATVLLDGRVLIVGGFGPLGDISRCEISEP